MLRHYNSVTLSLVTMRWTRMMHERHAYRLPNRLSHYAGSLNTNVRRYYEKYAKAVVQNIRVNCCIESYQVSNLRPCSKKEPAFALNIKSA
jgi:hypothetical protein